MNRDGLTRDYFGRVICTHQCPDCGARFLGDTMCRGAGDGPGRRAHDAEVQTLPVYQCAEPPTRRWAVALPVLVAAPTEEKAYALALGVVDAMFPKRIAERVRQHVHVEALEPAALPTIQRGPEGPDA